MRESTIEAYLRDKVKAMGGKAYKWVSPGCNGIPDRIIALPKGTICFVELKAPGKKPTPLQMAQMSKLRDLGFDARVVDSKQGVDALVSELAEKIK